MRLKRKLAAGQCVRFFGLGTFQQPEWITLLGLQGGWDAVWLDDEHIGLDRRVVAVAATAAKAVGLDSFVRLQATSYSAVMRPLEAGCTGIMAAQVRSASEVEQIVRWAKFHPRGVRGINTLNADNDFGLHPTAEYLRTANERVFVAVQIENAEALADIDAICQVPDLDLVFIGPADLSQSLGIPGEFQHPKLRQAVESIAAAARKHRRPWSILPIDDHIAKDCLELGCQGFLVGFDAQFIRLGALRVQEMFPHAFAGAEPGFGHQ